ncbi:MAG: FecR domain-containing protein [Prevotella sp.]
MDKIERIIDMTEHPERYTEDELRQLLIDDDEGNRIYKTISELNVAFNMDSGMRLSQKTKKYHFINKVAAAIIAICLISGIAYAAVALTQRPSTSANVEATAPSSPSSPATQVSDVPVSNTQTPIVKTYEDTPLSTIVADIARVFSKQQAYRSDKAQSLRLYFRLDTRRGLEKNIEELNTFENINIEIKGDTLVVD